MSAKNDIEFWVKERDLAVADSNEEKLDYANDRIHELLHRQAAQDYLMFGEVTNTDKLFEAFQNHKTVTDEAIKHDLFKPRMELLSRTALEEISNVLSFGAKKYAAHNWRLGMDWSRLYGAAMRHLTAHMDGEDVDPESGLSHLAHLGCCVMFLLEYEQKGLGTDDRYKQE